MGTVPQDHDSVNPSTVNGQCGYPENAKTAPLIKKRWAEVQAFFSLPELARELDLIAAIRRDLAAVGIVGEEEKALLVYMVYTSRLLNDPLAIVTRGVTGSGKSALLDKTAKLFPPKSIVRLLKHTDASLFNGPEDGLRHKILLTGERKHSTDAATRDANILIRQLLSEKRINRSTSVRAPGEAWVTDFQEREGPVAYAESTTSKSIFEEDLNRMLELHTDASPDQNRKVMLAIGRKYDPEAEDNSEKEAIRRHHSFQESLKSYEVAVPYWKRLVEGIPHNSTRSRRITQQVLSVVEAVTLLHQHCRNKDAKGKLIATADDYAIARQLLVKPLLAAFGIGETKGKKGKNTIGEYLRLRKVLRSRSFDSNEALKHFGNKVTRDRTLKKLCELGVLQQQSEGSSHTPAVWRWVKSLSEMVLPSVESVTGSEG